MTLLILNVAEIATTIHTQKNWWFKSQLEYASIQDKNLCSCVYVNTTLNTFK